MRRPGSWVPLTVIAALFLVSISGLINPVTLRLLYSGGFIAMSVLVAMIYLPGLIQAIREPRASSDQYLASGIVLLWFCLGVSQIWASTAIALGRPPWMLNHWILGLLYAISAVSGYYFLRAFPDARVWNNWRWVTVGLVALVIAFTGYAIYYNDGTIPHQPQMEEQ